MMFVLPSCSITVPVWIFLFIPLILGVIFMWRSGVNEASGIRKLTSCGRDIDLTFRRMGRFRVLAYLMALLFFWMVIQIEIWHLGADLSDLTESVEVFKGELFGGG